MEFLSTAFTLILGLGLLVFLHELGHFVMAKITGTKVEQFSIGFPPTLFGVKIGDTEYTIGAVPIGGFVKVAGMIQEATDVEIDDSDNNFSTKNTFQKSLILLGGVFFNILTAVLIFTYFNLRDGDVKIMHTQIQTIPHHNPLKKYLPEENITILKVNDTEIKSINSFMGSIRDNFGETFSITYRTETGQIQTKLIPENLPISKHLFFPIDGIFESQIYVRRVVENTLAEKIGLQENDTITHINNYQIRSFNGLIGALNSNVDQTVDIEIKRDLDTLHLTAHLIANKDDEVKLGFYPGFTVDTAWFKTLISRQELSLTAALSDGFVKSYYAFVIQLKGLMMMVRGDLSVSENLGGPVAIANEFSKTVGNLDAFLRLVAIMSLALAFFNLLPLPVFDGGSLVIVLVEGVRGRELATDTKLKIQRVGFLFIIMLMIFVFTNDISRLF